MWMWISERLRYYLIRMVGSVLSVSALLRIAASTPTWFYGSYGYGSAGAHNIRRAIFLFVSKVIKEYCSKPKIWEIHNLLCGHLIFPLYEILYMFGSKH